MNVHDLIACPTCHARVDQPCRSASGHTTTHSNRLAPRLCPCGMTLKPRRTLCDWCATQSIKATKRAYARRKRAA